MSDIRIPGLDIDERNTGAFRARVRVHPFFALTDTFPTELAAIAWGCAQVGRLHALHKRLCDEERLPTVAVTRKDAQVLGIAELIAGDDKLGAQSAVQESLGDSIFVFDVLDSYLSGEAKEHISEYGSRARHLKNFFGNVAISSITTQRMKAYIAARFAGELGNGRSATAEYASRNREYQKNLRRKRRGVPIVRKPRPFHPPSNDSVRHELKLFRRSLKVFITRDDALRERVATYIGTHPITCVELPSPGEPRKRRISNTELRCILGKMSCPMKRAAIMIGIYTSLRRAEVVSLQTEDVDWAASTVRLRAPTEPDPARPGARRKKRKTKTVERDVPLVPEALELLRVICTNTKGPIFKFKASSLTQAFGRAAEDAGVTDVRVHDARREALSWLHDVYGLTLEQLTMFSGHTEVKTLQRHYFQPSASKMAATLAKKPEIRRDAMLDTTLLIS